MTLANRARRFTVVLAAVVAIAYPAAAQDISDAHLKAAREAVTAIKATDLFDGILPASAIALKQSLIQKNPDLSDLISKTVDEKAIAMASRRADLEKEAALAYARVFPIEDLTAIAAFYNSEAGKKLLTDGPIVSREVGKAADIWQRGLARDLAEEVGKTLQATLKTMTPPDLNPTDPAPAPAVAPAPAPAN